MLKCLKHHVVFSAFWLMIGRKINGKILQQWKSIELMNNYDYIRHYKLTFFCLSIIISIVNSKPIEK